LRAWTRMARLNYSNEAPPVAVRRRGHGTAVQNAPIRLTPVITPRWPERNASAVPG
jgi:hypothetical protein